MKTSDPILQTELLRKMDAYWRVANYLSVGQIYLYINPLLNRPRGPMMIFNSPKGLTGPKMVDGLQVEGTFRSHQVPLSAPATLPEIRNWKWSNSQ